LEFRKEKNSFAFKRIVKNELVRKLEIAIHFSLVYFFEKVKQ